MLETFRCAWFHVSCSIILVTCSTWADLTQMLRLRCFKHRQFLGRFFTTSHVQFTQKNDKKHPPFLTKRLQIKPQDNPFKGVFTENMGWDERWEAIQKLENINLSEGLSMILSDPELGVGGALAIGKEFERHRRLVKELSPGPKKALLIQSGVDALMKEELKRTIEEAAKHNHKIKVSCQAGTFKNIYPNIVLNISSCSEYNLTFV